MRITIEKRGKNEDAIKGTVRYESQDELAIEP